MGKGDVFIKGANALDPNGKAAAFLASSSGGTIGVAYGTIRAKGINLIIPVGFEKAIPLSVHEIANEVGIETVDYSMGLRYGFLPMDGLVITEQAAIKKLTGADAYPIGCGGINGAEGAVILLLKGSSEQVKRTLKIVWKIKREKTVKLNIDISECSECLVKHLFKCW